MLHFRDADQDVLYESVAAGRAAVREDGIGLIAHSVFAGDRSHATDPERIRRARSPFELAAVMNDICPHLAAMRDAFRVSALGVTALGVMGPFSDIHVWGGFVPTVDRPDIAAGVQQDATYFTLARLLDRMNARKWKPGEDPLAKARPFLKENFTAAESGKIENDLIRLGAHRRLGRMDVFGAKLVEDDTHTLVLQHVLELATGVEAAEAMLGLPSTMAEYSVPLGRAFDEPEAQGMKKSILFKFQTRLKSVIAQGDISGNHRMAYEGSKLRYTFSATRHGAQTAADQLAPLTVQGKDGEAFAPARILMC